MVKTKKTTEYYDSLPLKVTITKRGEKIIRLFKRSSFEDNQIVEVIKK